MSYYLVMENVENDYIKKLRKEMSTTSRILTVVIISIFPSIFIVGGSYGGGDYDFGESVRFFFDVFLVFFVIYPAIIVSLSLQIAHLNRRIIEAGGTK